VLHKRISDLPNWGQGGAAAFKPGENFSVSLDKVIIERTIPGQKNYVTIVGNFDGRTVFYGLGPLDEKILPKVGKIVDDNRGETLLFIGTIEIPPDED
jgi:hypothetical protein